MKRIILSILLLIVTISPNLQSQELPVFGITGVDASEFPLVKSYFIAKNGYLNDSYYKGAQNVPNPPDFDLSENGVSKDLTSLIMKCADIDGELPVHIAMVVDASASMFNVWNNGETRADVLKRAVAEFIDSVKFKNGTSMHIVPFSGNSIPPHVWKDWNYTAADAKADFAFYTQLEGRTDFNIPMYKEPNGRNVLEIFKSRPINDRKVVVFLTDGAHDNTNGNNPFKYELIIQELQKRGIEFHSITFAVDDQSSVSDLRRISQATGGVNYNAYSEEELRDIYKEITDGFKSTSVCWLEWLSQLECDEVTERNVEVTFTRKTYTPITRNITYTPPADKAIAEITRDKDVLYFDNNGKTIQEVTLTAKTGDFHVTGFTVTDNNGNFDIPEFASVPPQGFVIEQGKSRKFVINYIKTPSDAPASFDLVFETDLCPTKPVELIAPCGPSTQTIDFGNVNLSGSTDYIATEVFLNTSKGEMKGNVTITGADYTEFTIKSVDGNAGAAFTLAAGESMDVVLTVTPSSKGAKTATLDYGIITDCGVATSEITANVIEASLNMAPLAWGLERIGNPVTKQYTITNTNDDPVEIESLSLTDATQGITLGDVSGSIGTVAPKGGTTTFDITFTPNVEGLITTDIEVKVKNRVEVITAKLSGTGYLPKLKGNNIAFPATEVNTIATPMNLVIENTSDYGKMVVRNVYIKNTSDMGFSVDLTDFISDIQLEKGNSISIPINFKPVSVGLLSGVVIVEADNVEGAEPVTFKLNEFTLTAESVPGDVITLDTTVVGPILSCETKDFLVDLPNISTDEQTVDAVLIQTGNNFSIPTNSFTIPQGAMGIGARVDYNPTSIGTHTAAIEYTYSDGSKFIAPIKGIAVTAIEELTFEKATYETELGKNLTAKFNIDLSKYNIRNDVDVNELVLTLRYNGRMLFMNGDGVKSNVGLTPTIDLSNQVNNNYVTFTFNGNIPLDKNLSFEVPLLATLGNDTVTTIAVDANFVGLECLAIETGTTTSFSIGCNISNSLIADLTFADKGYDVGLVGENPVNDVLKINYELPYENNVRIELYNSTGELTKVVKDGTAKFGISNENLDVSDLPSGVYMLRFISGPYVESQTFVKVK
ncbi:MAG: choice-of-anchor D domain-containing protein [Candidatus Kapaibacterium sp.]